MTVTKATFLAGVTCPTKGWFTHRAPGEEATPAAQWRWYDGNEVQRVARTQLGEHSPTLRFEATFSAAGCTARADAVRGAGDNVELIEIKAATIDDDNKIKAELIDDISYTAFVMTAAGTPPSRCVLMLVDKAHRTGGALPLMREMDVTDVVRARAAEFASMAKKIVAAAHAEDRPEPVLIHECKKCEFFATQCLGVGVDDSIFHIPRLLKPQFNKLQPHTRLSELPMNVSLTDAQMRFLLVWRTQEPFVDRAALAALDQIAWPVHYLDFEGAAPALPWFEGDAPYRTLLFQYSIHTRHAPTAELVHRAFLAEIGGDWRRALAESLLRDLGEVGSIVVYTHYEKTQLRDLGELFPDLKPAIDAVIARLVDLAKVIAAGYEHPGFLGRTSIKEVLPVMAPDLSYDELQIAGGMDAAAVFALMQVGQSPVDGHAQHRANLLQYCGLDTMAMVRVHQELEKIR